MKTRATHTRPRARTTEAAVAWMRNWDNRHFLQEGALPWRPWRNTSQREMEAVVDGLMKLRARYDGGDCRG